jgi:DNA-directed RNA polymerase specialized sigma subunit
MISINATSSSSGFGAERCAVMSIDKLIDQLDREAGFQFSSLSRDGYRVTRDEVLSEVCLAFCEAVKAYKKDNQVKFETFFAGCVRSGMKVFRRKLRRASRIKLDPEAQSLATVEPDNGTSLIIAEIDQQLTKHEKLVFNYMINGGERPTFPGYHNAVSKVRSIAKTTMEV